MGSYIVVREELRAQDNVVPVVRFWIGEEVERYGGDVCGSDGGEFSVI